MLTYTKRHQEQDNFIKGAYELDGKGCAIMSINKLKGTNLKCNRHEQYENFLGIPEWIARLELMRSQ